VFALWGGIGWVGFKVYFCGIGFGDAAGAAGGCFEGHDCLLLSGGGGGGCGG